MGRDFLTTRSKFQKTYPTNKITPRFVSFVEADVSRSFDRNTMMVYHHRYYIVASNESSSVNPAEFEEILIDFTNESQKTVNFVSVFSQTPVVIAVPEPNAQNTHNLNVFLSNLTQTQFDINLSSKFTGQVRYKAVYSPTWPAAVSYGVYSYTLYAGVDHVTGSNTFSYTYAASSAPLSDYWFTAYDDTNLSQTNIGVVASGSDGLAVSGSLSSDTTGTINFIGTL